MTLLLAMAVYGLAGCTKYRSPSMSLAGVSITDTTDEAVALGIELALQNPNASPIDLTEFRYTLHIDGKEAFRGRRAAAATLIGAGQRRLVIPAIVSFERMGWGGEPPPELAYTLSVTLHYTTPGEIAQRLFDTGVRRPRTRISQRGRIRLRGPG